MRLLLSLLITAPLAAACTPMAAPGGLAPSPIAAELGAIFDDPALAHAHWGVRIESLATGETLFERNEEKLFIPASNMKLVTGAAALETLGPDYRFNTQVAAGGPIQNGTLEGFLVVTGTGDPTFSGRFLSDPRDSFRAWADSLRTRGVTRIIGGIVAVDTAFSDPTLGAGWMWDDLAGGYSAEFGALQFNEGVVQLEIFPSQNELEPAVIVLDPPSQYVRIINDTRTMPPGSVTAIRITRDEAGSTLIVTGEIAADAEAESRELAVRSPSLFFVNALRETLREQGITVEGPAIHYGALGIIDPAIRGAVPLFDHRSPPLSEILPAMMKPSQNQIAETLLRAVGREMRGEGAADGGVAVVDSLFLAWDIGDGRIRIADGSGLSRYSLLSPALLTELLIRMDQSSHRDLWLASLPVAGVDGTLANRMRDAPLVDQVRAKTGTLSGIRALSGYLTTAGGERVVFSTIVNHSVAGSAAADAVVERALAAIAASR